jgi:hypothetical protein
MVKRPWFFVNDIKKPGKVLIYDRPHPGSNKNISQVNLFDIRYAYVICRGQTTEEDYILIGNDPWWNVDDPPANLTGWIKRSHTILWPNLLGVYYNDETKAKRNEEPIIFFEEMLNAKDYKNSKGQREEKAIFKVPNNYDQLEYFMNRFPILDDDGKDKEIIKVAFINQGTDLLKNQKIRKKEVEKKVQEKRELFEKLVRQDILFLIDGTGSMGAYFQEVSNAINQFLKPLRRETRERFRFAAAVFRDYNNQNDDNRNHPDILDKDCDKAFEMVSNFKKNHDGISEIKEKLDPKKLVKGGGNVEEALFCGIIRAVEVADWGVGHSRGIVVIGDQGNHVPDIFAEEDVIAALHEDQVLFHAINVNPSQYDQSGELFRTQTNKILSGHKKLGGLSKTVTISKNCKSKECGLEKVAMDNMVHALTKIKFLRGETVKAFGEMREQNASIEEIQNQYGPIVTSYMLALMEKEGLKTKDIQINLEQFAKEAWALKNSLNDHPNFKVWLYMNKTDFHNLLGFLEQLQSTLASTSRGKGLTNAITAMTSRAAGDKLKPNERISDFLERTTHIPYKQFSRFLQYTPTQLAKKFRDDKNFRISLRKRLCEKVGYLAFVNEQKEGEILIKGGSCVAKISDKEKKWWKRGETQKEYAWIPANFFP